MPKYVIERLIPGAGNLVAEDLGAISLVTDDEISCAYIVPRCR
jgi:hypothetical protein